MAFDAQRYTVDLDALRRDALKLRPKMITIGNSLNLFPHPIREVRAIAEVATAVTRGDLSRSIALDAQGEMAALKDTINEMIRNLKDTTLKNSEQDWLKTNLAKFSRMLQGQRDLTNVGRMVLSELCPVVSARHAEFYILDNSVGDPKLKLLASYASEGREMIGKQIELGKGLVGQCAIEKQKIALENLPPDYIRISSGLGEAPAAPDAATARPAGPTGGSSD